MTGTEKRVFAVLGAITLGAFIILTLMVTTGYTQATDLKIASFFYQIRGQKDGIIFWVFRFITELGYLYVLVFIIVTTAIKWRFDKKTFCLGFGCLAIYLANELVKLLFRRERPDILMQWTSESSTSYPSGHSMTSMFAYGILVFFLVHSSRTKNQKIAGTSVMGAIVLLIGISRMILGVHYFTDVIGGFLLGFLGLILILMLYNYFYSIGFDFLKPHINRRAKTKIRKGL